MTTSGTAPVIAQTFYKSDVKIWHGPKAEARFGPQDSIGSAVLAAMRKYPDNIIQIGHQSGKQITNREMVRLSIQVARHFHKLKLEQCDMIGMCTTNSDYVAPLFFGAMFAGLCISPSDPSFNENGLKHVYSMTRPKLMFCDAKNYYKIREAFNECGLSSCKIYTMQNDLEGVPNIMEFLADIEDEEAFRVPALKEGFEQIAMILCTSGSTGLPKGVRMSHAALLNATTLGVDFPPRVLCFGSLHGSVGIFMLIQSATDRFTRIISENPFSAAEFCDIVRIHRVNVSANYPSHIPLLLKSNELSTSDLSSLRLMYVAGKTIPYTLIEKLKPFASNCIFRTYYGLTEVCGAITSTPMEPTDPVGRMLVNTEAKILNDNGEHMGPNEMGEMVVRKQYPASGYLNNPLATKAMYDTDGWVHTGDVGYFNDDGQMYIVDRRKDILKYNNFPISPTNIEKVICEISEVAEACVAGIPDSIYDFLPAAAVIVRPGAHIKESDIVKHVANRMQDFEKLRGGVYFFQSLPQTASGKTNRIEVTELCKNRRNALINMDSSSMNIH